MSPRFFERLNYSSVNEDWRTEVVGLALRDGAHVLCITGSGDRPLDLLATADAHITAIDRNAVQNRLLRLKMAALGVLPFPEYAAFLGLTEASPSWRLDVLRRLEAHLPGADSAFWSVRPAMVGTGVLYAGAFERHCRLIARVARLLRRRAVEALFAFTDLDEQRRFVTTQWDRRAWRLAYRAMLHPWMSRVLLRDPAYYAHVTGSPGGILFDRMRAILLRGLARENFMMNLVFRGALTSGDLPPYLTPDGHARIGERLHRIAVVDSDVVEYLTNERSGPFTHFSLSDVLSYLPQFRFRELLEAVAARAAPGARVVIRQFLTRYEVPRQASWLHRERLLEAQLAEEDRSFGYEFIVGTVDVGVA